MRAPIPLSVKILLVATLNIAVLVAAGATFVTYELGREFTSVLLAPSRDRILAVARQLALDMDDTDETAREELVERYQREYGVAFLLVQNDGVRIAGPARDVPSLVMRRITEGGPRQGRDGRPGPPPPPGGRGPTDGAPRLPSTPPFLVTTDGPDKYWVGVRIPIRARGRVDTIPGTLLLASSTLLGNPFFFQPFPWLAIVAATLGLTVACWWPLVRGVSRSIGDMTRATGDIADGRFDVVVRQPRRDELGVLAASIQAMSGRLKLLVDGQKRFLGDVAHELRSPLGRISLLTELIERDATDATRPRIDDLREDVAHMARLTDELLAFARAELAAREIRVVSTGVHDAVTRAATVESGDTNLLIDVEPAIHVMADADLLFRALSNVIRNAVQYAGDRGPITIAAKVDGPDVVITVSDHGPGLHEQDLQSVFAPFYRPEVSRNRRSGGVGLGLAIVRSAVEACHGSVACRNLSPSGLEVRISLPAA